MLCVSEFSAFLGVFRFEFLCFLDGFVGVFFGFLMFPDAFALVFLAFGLKVVTEFRRTCLAFLDLIMFERFWLLEGFTNCGVLGEIPGLLCASSVARM